jgi:hypothetical protein
MPAFLVTAALLFPTAAAAPAATAPAATAPAAAAPAAPAPAAEPAPAAAAVEAAPAPVAAAPAVVPDHEEPPRSAGPDALVDVYDDEAVIGPVRSGFTLEGSIGLGFTHINPADGDYESDTRAGLSGGNIGIGGFVNPRTAITLRIAGTLFRENDTNYTAVFAGPAIQHWVGERAFIGAGFGLGLLGVSLDDEVGDDEMATESGAAFDLRVGYDIVSGRRGALHLAFELTPGLYDGGMVTGVGFQIGGQLF